MCQEYTMNLLRKKRMYQPHTNNINTLMICQQYSNNVLRMCGKQNVIIVRMYKENTNNILIKQHSRQLS